MKHAPATTASIAAGAFIEAKLRQRNLASSLFFDRHADALAHAAAEMAERFGRGGRLLAFGRGPYATDAQHVEVEFVHPVLVGKRALAALDISTIPIDSLESLFQPEDMVMALGPPAGDPALESLLARAAAAGTQTFALPGTGGSFFIPPSDMDPFVHQELVEILYHTLWETVHVFFEHREIGYDVGAAGFLYPFLGRERQDTSALLVEVAASIRAKAADVERLRVQVAREQSAAIVRATLAIRERVRSGGRLLLFGNGGSATDANDWALDCVASPGGYETIPALSLAAAPAVLSALANDVGPDEMFLRQMIAHARERDVAIAISTSGGSRNVIAALDEARRRGLLTVALLGHDGGEVLRRGAADHTIVVRSEHVPRVQEVQASIYHVMLALMDALRRGVATA